MSSELSLALHLLIKHTLIGGNVITVRRYVFASFGFLVSIQKICIETAGLQCQLVTPRKSNHRPNYAITSCLDPLWLLNQAEKTNSRMLVLFLVTFLLNAGWDIQRRFLR